MSLLSLLILLFAILAPAAVLLVAGVWAVRKGSGDVSQAVGVVAIILGLLLVILAILAVVLTPAPTSVTWS